MASEYEKFREEHILPSGLTPKQAEEEGRRRVEVDYLEAFALGLSRYYEDERCSGERETIRANADGSEDLVDYEWETRKATLLKRLQPAGMGKYAYLLKDPRYLELVKR